MPLTDTMIRNAKTPEKPVKLFDGGGLFLLLSPTGSRCWRYKYRIGGKEKLLALGVYPEVTLKEARDKLEKARKMLADGIDPGEQRKAQKAAGVGKAENSFEVVAREWFAKFSTVWVPRSTDTLPREGSSI